VVLVANYGMIALLDMTAGALIPLVWSTSVEFDGLSMSPASIGLWMAGYGFMNCIFQFVAFPCIGRFGPWRVFIASIILFFPSVHVPLREPGVTLSQSRPKPISRTVRHAAALSNIFG